MNEIDKLLFKIYGPYPCLSPVRYQSFFVLRKLFKEKKIKKGNILEVGCGSGIYVAFLDNLMSKGVYTGIDIEFKQNEKIMQGRVKRIKSIYKKMDAKKLLFKDNSFDLVLSFWSLEHIKDDIKVLKEARRVLKKEGVFFLIVPSIFTFPFQLGRHGFHYYTKKDIISKLEKTGFKLENLFSIGGLGGYLFSLVQNWLDLLVLAPFALFFKIFTPKKIKGDSRQDIKGGLAKKIVRVTTRAYQKSLTARKIHFYLLKLIKVIDKQLPVLPTSYFLVVKK